MPMNPTRLLIGRRQAVVTITLNRPEVHNAFDETLIAELTAGFTEAAADPDVRAIVLQGAGPSFCAGGDLNWMARMAAYSHAENLADAQALQGLFEAIVECPKVTLAQVHGAAMGGGVGLVAACDIALAAEEARFAFSEARIGLAPAVIAPYVIQKIGMGAARALFVTGERFGADEALRIGLVQQVVPSGELEAVAQRKVEGVLQAGPEAVAAAKRLLRAIAGKTPPEAAEATAECLAALRASPEGQEGIRAFLEKRKPDFAA